MAFLDHSCLTIRGNGAFAYWAWILLVSEWLPWSKRGVISTNSGVVACLLRQTQKSHKMTKRDWCTVTAQYPILQMAYPLVHSRWWFSTAMFNYQGITSDNAVILQPDSCIRSRRLNGRFHGEVRVQKLHCLQHFSHMTQRLGFLASQTWSFPEINRGTPSHHPFIDGSSMK